MQKRENGDYKPKTQDLKHVQETLQLLSVMTNDHRFEEVYNEASDAQKGEMRNMCEILDKIENRGIEKGRAEGRAEGIAEGNVEGKNQMADLMKRLLDENRIEDAKRAAEDPAYCDELMKQFLDTVREVRSLRAEVEEDLMRVHKSFTVASALMSSEALEQALW